MYFIFLHFDINNELDFKFYGYHYSAQDLNSILKPNMA